MSLITLYRLHSKMKWYSFSITGVGTMDKSGLTIHARQIRSFSGSWGRLNLPSSILIDRHPVLVLLINLRCINVSGLLT